MKNKTIGLFGAIGYDDMGDDALLLSNLEAFEQKGYNIVIFSNNTSRTKNLLISNGFLTDSSISNKTRIVKNLNYYIKSHQLYMVVDIIVNRLLKSSYDIVRTVNYYYVANKICKELDRKDMSNSQYLEYITNIKECSLILFIGGGYMNKYWGYHIYQFINALSIADKLGIPCVASGQTFGPFDYLQKSIVKKNIFKLKSIQTRDINRSKKRLLELGYHDDKITEGPDDAIFFSRNEDYVNRYNAQFIVIINLGSFISYAKLPLETMYTILAQFFDYLVENRNAIILNISMTTREQDIDRGESIQSKMKYKEKFRYIALFTDLKTIKAIISSSNLVVSSRLHPIVFAISEKRPFIGISSDGEYYDSKLMGISEIYNYRPENHIIRADDLTLDKLKQCFILAMADKYDRDHIYELNKNKREQFLKKIEDILMGKNV
ncbi:MAG TPA: hypothetical protein DDY59_06835 [Lachnospiraceae bacterium]|nr:hypothetical protein [Lachnospiraceae bacterium]